MANKIILLYLISVLCISIHQVGCSMLRSYHILDDKPSKTKSVLKFICEPSKGHEKQISRLSTIGWLNKQFRANVDPTSGRPFTGKNLACRQRNMDLVESLYNVITISSDDICSDQKISAIESFHRKFIAESVLKKHRPGHGTNHEPLKLFFMHYASEVTMVCRRHMIENLKLLDNRREYDYESLFKGGSLNRLVEGVHKYLGTPNSIKDFDDFVLLWNMIDDYNRRKERSSSSSSGQSSGDNIFSESGSVGRFEPRVKLKTLGEVASLQDRCLNSLKPIYGRITLPFMRLVDLGYYRSGIESMKDLKSNKKQIINWYGVTQACEALLGIKLYQDESLQPDEVVLITREEAKLLQAKRGKSKSLVKRPIEFAVKRHNFGSDDSLRSVYVDKAKKMIKAVKINLKDRARVFKKILVKLAADLKGQLKNKVKHFFVSRKSDNPIGGSKFVKENAEPLISSSLVKAQKFISEQSDSLDSLNRRKRCISIAIAIIAVVAIIVLVVLVIVILFLIG